MEIEKSIAIDETKSWVQPLRDLTSNGEKYLSGVRDVCEALLEEFTTRTELDENKGLIIAVITSGMSAESKSTLIATELLRRSQFLTADEKLLFKKRTEILRIRSCIYKEIANTMFLPQLTPAKKTKFRYLDAEGKTITAQEACQALKSAQAVETKSESEKSSDEEEEKGEKKRKRKSPTKKKVKAEGTSGEEPVQKTNETTTPSKYVSSRWGKSKGKNPEDAFYSHSDAITCMLPIFLQFKEQVIFEPANGTGSLSDVLEKHGCNSIIKRDLYSMDEKHDFLISAPPSYDFLITNPPWSLVREFLFKAYWSEKPFAILGPLDLISRTGVYRLFENYGCDVHVLVPSPKFFHKGTGKWANTASVAWYLGNFPDNGETMRGKVNIKLMLTQEFKREKIVTSRFSQVFSQEFSNIDECVVENTQGTNAEPEAKEANTPDFIPEEKEPTRDPIWACDACGHLEFDEEEFVCCCDKKTI